jgi:CspA family cold shock protein
MPGKRLATHPPRRAPPGADVRDAFCGSTAMPQGNVKWFDSKKGFGFIINPEGKDVFVHFTSIEGDGFRSLKDGEAVDYEQIQGEKGLLAQHVRRLAQLQNQAGQPVKPA